jgi:protein TonB
MDAVGDIIAERAHERLPLGVGASLAVLLHAGLVGAVLVSSLAHPTRFVPTRYLQVSLRSAGGLKGRAVEVAAPPAPAPEEAAKPRILKPPDEPPPPPSEKAKLLPKDDTKKVNPPLPAHTDPKGKSATSTPGSHETPAAEPSGSSTGGAGTAAEGAAGTGVGGLKFDQPGFNYPYYYERVKIAIETNWFKPATSIPTSPVVHFIIQKDGTITDATLVTSSGLTYVDRAALRAVMAASPLPPLPSDFSSSQIGLSVLFE